MWGWGRKPGEEDSNWYIFCSKSLLLQNEKRSFSLKYEEKKYCSSAFSLTSERLKKMNYGRHGASLSQHRFHVHTSFMFQNSVPLLESESYWIQEYLISDAQDITVSSRLRDSAFNCPVRASEKEKALGLLKIFYFFLKSQLLTWFDTSGLEYRTRTCDDWV